MNFAITLRSCKGSNLPQVFKISIFATFTFAARLRVVREPPPPLPPLTLSFAKVLRNELRKDIAELYWGVIFPELTSSTATAKSSCVRYSRQSHYSRAVIAIDFSPVNVPREIHAGLGSMNCRNNELHITASAFIK